MMPYLLSAAPSTILYRNGGKLFFERGGHRDFVGVRGEDCGA